MRVGSTLLRTSGLENHAPTTLLLEIHKGAEAVNARS